MELSFDAVINAADELELIPLVRDAIRSKGAEWFVFVSLHPTDHSASWTATMNLSGVAAIILAGSEESQAA
jgi:hypothetical protein